jgi:P63C domain
MELTQKEKIAAKAFARMGGLKGGKARAEALTPEERSESARQAANARWAQRADEQQQSDPASQLPKADYKGLLKIGDLEIPCFVLDDGRRVISGRGMMVAIGMRGRGQGMARIASHRMLESLETNDLRLAIENPIKFTSGSPKVGDGFEATVLHDLCEAILRARDAGVLKTEQEMRYGKCADLLIRAFARVGIIALVDEATGYQAERDRDALHKILEAYIAKELLPWTKRFPDEFYQQMFRLQGWQYSPLSTKRPRLVAQLTVHTVYDRLPPGVLEELRKDNPIIKDGRRRYKLFQFMTEDIGQPHLEKHLASVTTLMRISPNWKTFKKLLDKAFPIPNKPGQPVQEDMGFDGELDEDVIDVEHILIDSEE